MLPVTITTRAHVGTPDTDSASRRDTLTALRLLSYADALFYLVGTLGELGVRSKKGTLNESDTYDALTLVSELGRGLMDSAEVIVGRLGSAAAEAEQKKGGVE